MRVTAGLARGHSLVTLRGDSVRPTADKVKQSIFNMIQFGVDGADILDIFCGSGALGIEALSRGAASAVFVDIDKRAVATTRVNLKHTKLREKATILNSDYKIFIKNCTNEKKYDIMFADPPYEFGVLSDLMANIADLGLLKDDGLLVFEGGKSLTPLEHSSFSLKKNARYGDTVVLIYSFKDNKEHNENSSLSR